MKPLPLIFRNPKRERKNPNNYGNSKVLELEWNTQNYAPITIPSSKVGWRLWKEAIDDSSILIEEYRIDRKGRTREKWRLPASPGLISAVMTIDNWLLTSFGPPLRLFSVPQKNPYFPLNRCGSNISALARYICMSYVSRSFFEKFA